MQYGPTHTDVDEYGDLLQLYASLTTTDNSSCQKALCPSTLQLLNQWHQEGLLEHGQSIVEH